MTLKEDASIASTANSSVHSSSAHNPTQTKKCCRFLLSVIPIILSLWKQQDENNRDQTVSPASQTMDVGGIEPMTVDGFAVAIVSYTQDHEAVSEGIVLKQHCCAFYRACRLSILEAQWHREARAAPTMRLLESSQTPLSHGRQMIERRTE